MGFPIAVVFAWILIIVEVLGGAALIFSIQTEKTIWPLFIVLLVALLLVHLPSFSLSNPQSLMNTLWVLVGLGALLSLHSTGPGELFGN